MLKLDVRDAPASRRTTTTPGRRIRVLRIIDRLNVGGPAKHVVWLTTGLDPARFDTMLVTGTVPPGETDMRYFAQAAGVTPTLIDEMSREPGLRDVVAFVRLLALLWRFQPDIVHTHKAKAGALGRAAATVYRWATPGALRLRPRACRVVHTYHGHVFHSYYGPLKTRIYLALERWLARCTDRIVVVSPRQRDEILERYRVGTPERVRVVPLGLDFDEIPDATVGVPTRLRRTPGTVIVGIVGRLTEIKDHRTFIAAVRSLRDLRMAASTGARFVVIGDGPLRPELERLADHLGVRDDIDFLGFRPDAASLASELDIAAITSLNEGTPLSLIEAMSAGRPVAATEVGGVPDLLGLRRAEREGFSIWDHGVSCAPRDAAAFARAIRFLVERPGLRDEMGQRARDFARRTFGRERLLRDVDTLYGELVDAARR